MVVFSDYGNCEEVLLSNIKPVHMDMWVSEVILLKHTHYFMHTHTHTHTSQQPCTSWRST